jgi:ribosomal silencing factor RsfS
MGLQGSRASFARLMDFVKTGVKGIITYIDDILVHSQDHGQHLKSLREALWRLRKYGLKLNRRNNDDRQSAAWILLARNDI